jgi:tetratricopeptide (TPR) repeat protein
VDTGCYYRRLITPVTISACLIVRNESLVLERCLSSLAGAVDEIVVVDTGSTDGTLEIATRFGARICHYEWRGDFASARNFGIDAASCNWILIIDADEYLEEGAQPQVRAIVELTDADGILVTQRNLLAADDLIQSADSQTLRLFRRQDGVRYEGIIHEEVAPAITRRGGSLATSSIVMVHDGYSRVTTQGSGSRAERNLPLLIRAAADAPQDPYLQYQLGTTYQQLGRLADAQQHLAQVLQLPNERLNPEVTANAAVRLAQLAMGERRDDRVVHYAAQALALEPNHVLAHYLSGISLTRLGRFAEAQAHLVAVKSSGKAGVAGAADLDALIAYCASNRG